jgi:hypothetical protein
MLWALSGKARNDLQHDVLQRGNPPPLALLDAGTSSATSRKASMSRQIGAGALKITVTKHVPDRGAVVAAIVAIRRRRDKRVVQGRKVWELSDGAGGSGLAHQRHALRVTCGAGI